MSQWVEIRPILEVCARETGYEGEGGGDGPAVAADGSGLPTEGYAKDILADAWERRRRESGRRGGRGDQQGAENGK